MLLRLSAAAVAVLITHAAFAQGTPAQRAACRPDVVKFCKGKGEDPGVLLQCLEDNKDKISEKCRGVIAVADPAPPTDAAKKDAPPAPAAEQKKEERPAELRDEKK
ncbi:MAG: cysteine rich repeat-containing protein [Alphaproteobacteria bacterium]|nr:cysteine rich repeat-containing protein [Alphaproteobacteria bacterium]